VRPRLGAGAVKGPDHQQGQQTEAQQPQDQVGNPGSPRLTSSTVRVPAPLPIFLLKRRLYEFIELLHGLIDRGSRTPVVIFVCLSPSTTQGR
jgi:hypothetical protein